MPCYCDSPPRDLSKLAARYAAEFRAKGKSTSNAEAFGWAKARRNSHLAPFFKQSRR